MSQWRSQEKEVFDAATPSGNSTMAINLHYLGIIFDNVGWIEHSARLVRQLRHAICKYPSSFANWACLLQQMVNGVPEIAVTGGAAFKILPELLKEYIPVKVLQVATEALDEFPLLIGKAFENDAKIYVCRNYSCEKPVSNVAEIKTLLK